MAFSLLNDSLLQIISKILGSSYGYFVDHQASKQYLLAAPDRHELVLVVKVNHSQLSATLLGFVQNFISIISVK